MAKEIQLGNEVEDIVTKVRGIAHGYVKYLDGSEHWIIQPPATEGDKAREIYSPIEYCSYVGEGVQAPPRKRVMGFKAPDQLE